MLRQGSRAPDLVDGSERVKVDPPPSTLVAVSIPPIAVANLRLIAKPRPVPSLRLESLLRICTNGSKMVSSLSAGMAIPLSGTLITPPRGGLAPSIEEWPLPGVELFGV